MPLATQKTDTGLTIGQLKILHRQVSTHSMIQHLTNLLQNNLVHFISKSMSRVLQDFFSCVYAIFDQIFLQLISDQNQSFRVF